MDNVSYAVIDTTRMCVIYKHESYDLLYDLGYIELDAEFRSTIISLETSESLVDFDDKQVWKLGLSVGLTSDQLTSLGDKFRILVIQTIRNLQQTKARSIEVALQADWIREHSVDAKDRYRYVFGDVVPTFGSLDYLPPAMVKDSGKGKREFKKSMKYKIFMYLNKLYVSQARPRDAKRLKKLCQSAKFFAVEEFGYKPSTTAQAISEWKKELLENGYKITKYENRTRKRRVAKAS